MKTISRRAFLQKSAMSLAAAYLSTGSVRLHADPLGLPIGLQLYTVKDELEWATAAGQDSVAYLTKYPGRFSLLHVKDVKSGFKPTTALEETHTTEIGHGVIDWKKVFAAAKKAGVKGYFVEQEAPFEKPALEAIKISYSYLHKLKVS